VTVLSVDNDDNVGGGNGVKDTELLDDDDIVGDVDVDDSVADDDDDDDDDDARVMSVLVDDGAGIAPIPT
jgi:hypothetical protein